MEDIQTALGVVLHIFVFGAEVSCNVLLDEDFLNLYSYFTVLH